MERPVWRVWGFSRCSRYKGGYGEFSREFKELEYFKNKFEKEIFVNHLQIELKRKHYKKEIIFKV